MEEQSTSGDEGERLTSRLRFDTLGQVFGTIAATGVGLFVLSFFGLFAFAVQSPDGAEMPLSHPTLIVGFGSWACVVISLFSYVIWAVRELRKQSRDSDRPISWKANDADPYGQRERRVVFALGFGVLFLLIPLAIFGGADGS
ncbi:hypothetical protein C483_04029 [Natrialba hulunbeirensis JCM 10989]|uniref:Uncharacterized protein n=1 Tax=Natrialba hulunbeirensis JCM 10989 TaxID=1227493 RepID=M0A4Y7_9EURY|nr:hypothetical protein C483_04029 [Natrialba hulunbeirensis JCM 10989]